MVHPTTKKPRRTWRSNKAKAPDLSRLERYYSVRVRLAADREWAQE
jgi:hypothetical protein